jgi:hypothetical protein
MEPEDRTYSKIECYFARDRCTPTGGSSGAVVTIQRFCYRQEAPMEPEGRTYSKIECYFARDGVCPDWWLLRSRGNNSTFLLQTGGSDGARTPNERKIE